MHLVDQLEVYLNKTEDILEKSHVLKTLDFITRTPQAFERQHETRGHMGASAVVLSEDRTRILLSKHSVLGVWSFFGNHSTYPSNTYFGDFFRFSLPAVLIYNT